MFARELTPLAVQLLSDNPLKATQMNLREINCVSLRLRCFSLIFCSALLAGGILSLHAGPVSGHVVGWNYTGFVPNDLPPNLTNIIAVAAGAGGNYYSQNLALRADGKVIAWGKTGSGQLATNVPAGVQGITAIAAGGDHYLALKSDGTVQAWQFSSLYSIPPAATNITAIAAGVGGACLALTQSGGLIFWYAGSTNFNTPLGLSSNIAAIAAGSSSFVAVRSNGTVVAWGLNNLGQTNVPAQTTNIIMASVAYFYGTGLRKDGTVTAWGDPDGTNVPAGLSNVTVISAGGVKGGHTAALKSDGTVITWGSSQTNVPSSVSNVVSIAAGDYYTLAVVADFQISGLGITNNRPCIEFQSFAGRQYLVEHSDNPSGPNWAPLTSSNLPGTGSKILVTDTNTPDTHRFYRLKQF